MPQIILASKSPRRLELLTRMGLVFDVVPSEYKEKLDENRPAAEVAIELALGKARDVAASHTEAIVIGADTIVAMNGRQLEKPRDIDDARQMLKLFAGKESTVCTGLAVVIPGKNVEITDVSTTKVYFKPESDEVARLREIYLASGDWQDKAGGYGIQSGAAVLIDHIDGDYETIVGLPTELLGDMLKRVGAL